MRESDGDTEIMFREENFGGERKQKLDFGGGNYSICYYRKRYKTRLNEFQGHSMSAVGSVLLSQHYYEN
jgi:hypothetical protein